ncbi:MAG: sigma-70 family RNA polymerase sigma factor [Planctomycetes bacterium]|nr:sigma-70 family RNA polymerase sigma factor [Planctomycetota bacterium]
MEAAPVPPPPPAPRDITLLLRAVHDGAHGAEDELVGAVYAELRRLAQSRLHGDRAGFTLGPTALVHEAWLRLGLADAGFTDRHHFFGAAARVMRQVLVDRHRRQHRQKRAHAEQDDVALDAIAAATELPPVDLVALDQALDELEALDARLAKIVQLRFFAGLSVEETAAALDVSPRTVKREWGVARLWLFQRMGAATTS